jgi:hypothetical protein
MPGSSTTSRFGSKSVSVSETRWDQMARMGPLDPPGQWAARGRAYCECAIDAFRAA